MSQTFSPLQRNQSVPWALIPDMLYALRDTANNTTQKFEAMWGEQHRLRVIGWFEHAQPEKAGTNTGSAPSRRAS